MLWSSSARLCEDVCEWLLYIGVKSERRMGGRGVIVQCQSNEASCRGKDNDGCMVGMHVVLTYWGTYLLVLKVSRVKRPSNHQTNGFSTSPFHFFSYLLEECWPVILTPFLTLQPFAKKTKNKKVHCSPSMYTQHPFLTEKQNCRHFWKFIKEQKQKYHMVTSSQTLCSARLS